MNKVLISGRMTRDLEVKESKNGTPVANFTIAVNSKHNGKAEADFIPCVLFGSAAERAANYLKKGIKINVEGRLQSGGYTVEGKHISTLSLIVSRWEFAERKMPEASEA